MAVVARDATVTIHGQEVVLWDDDLFGALRERDGLRDDFLAQTDLGVFRHSGGKGGEFMAHTTDDLFIIKELKKGDHDTLLRLAGSYVARVLSGSSLLCVFYMHYTQKVTGRHYIVMQNLLRNRGHYRVLYDLKACADDKTLETNGVKVPTVKKRIWQVHMWGGQCAWSEARHKYHDGKVEARKAEIPVTEAQRSFIVSSIDADTEWLALHQVMDYSLLVGIRRIDREVALKEQALQCKFFAGPVDHQSPLVCQGLQCNEGEVDVIDIGIIDFLQTWDAVKQVAMCVKFLEVNKSTIPPPRFAARFRSEFSRRIVGSSSLPEVEKAFLPADPSHASFPVNLHRFPSDASRLPVLLEHLSRQPPGPLRSLRDEAPPPRDEPTSCGAALCSARFWRPFRRSARQPRPAVFELTAGPSGATPSKGE